MLLKAPKDLAPTDDEIVLLTGIKSAHTSRERRSWNNDNDNSRNNQDKDSKSSKSKSSKSSTTTPNTTTPAAPAPAAQGYTTHTHIVTTVFWVGEAASAANGGIPNAASTWDESWQQHFGGYDNPDSRKGYLPTGFTPTENPFYFALPYSDLDDNGNRRASAGSCPESATKSSQKTSWCKNTWIAVTNEANNKTCYAQWEDAGPYGENDTAYVFGTAAPANKVDTKAGLDVSPAARDCLGMGDEAKTTWKFVSAASVPAGPWKNVITTTPSYEAN